MRGILALGRSITKNGLVPWRSRIRPPRIADDTPWWSRRASLGFAVASCLLPAGTPGMDQENVLARTGQRRAIVGNKNLLHISNGKYEVRRRMSRRSSRPGGRWSDRPAKCAGLKGSRRGDVRTAQGSTRDGNCHLGIVRVVSVQGMPGRHTADRHTLRLFLKGQVSFPGGATSRLPRQIH